MLLSRVCIHDIMDSQWVVNFHVAVTSGLTSLEYDSSFNVYGHLVLWLCFKYSWCCILWNKISSKNYLYLNSRS